MATADLYRLAGLSSWVSLVALVLSGIALALFFGGAGDFWGPVNDALIVATAIALILPVLAVARLAGDRSAPWVLVVSVAAVAGLVLIAVGQTLLIVGRLSLDGSYVTGGLGVVPVLAWIVLIAVLSLGSGVLPSTTGWLAVATLAAIVVLSIVAVVTRGPVLWVAGVGLLVVISAWLAALASSLGASAAAAEAAATVATRVPA
jgi:hypothetical protein